MEKVNELIYDRGSFIDTLDRMKDLINLAFASNAKYLDPEAQEILLGAFNANAEYLESAYDYLVSRLQHSETERFKL